MSKLASTVRLLGGNDLSQGRGPVGSISAAVCGPAGYGDGDAHTCNPGTQEGREGRKVGGSGDHEFEARFGHMVRPFLEKRIYRLIQMNSLLNHISHLSSF